MSKSRSAMYSIIIGNITLLVVYGILFAIYSHSHWITNLLCSMVVGLISGLSSYKLLGSITRVP